MTAWALVAVTALAVWSLWRAGRLRRQCYALAVGMDEAQKEADRGFIYRWAAMRELDDNGKKRAWNVAEAELKKRGLWKPELHLDLESL